jgi:hypothetical protein
LAGVDPNEVGLSTATLDIGLGSRAGKSQRIYTAIKEIARSPVDDFGGEGVLVAPGEQHAGKFA